MKQMWMPELPPADEDGRYSREDMCRYAAEVCTKWDKTNQQPTKAAKIRCGFPYCGGAGCKCGSPS